MTHRVTTHGHGERILAAEDMIVSKTDTRGVMTYVNQTFVDISGYSESELLGRPHNLIRHPDMPRGVFKLLWDTIAAGHEVFAYVVNRAKDGQRYWVLAHVTPTFGPGGAIVGYHSSRRAPSRAAVRQVEPVYARMREEEARHANARDAAQASLDLVAGLLADQGLGYDEFVWSIIAGDLVGTG
jgi:PAS domain S-box-containing protein